MISDAELVANGYIHIKHMPDGEIAAVLPLMFTHAIVSGLNEWGYEDRWCYQTEHDALNALNDWNGEGEPTGWHRHPATGRRVHKDGTTEIRA